MERFIAAIAPVDANRHHAASDRILVSVDLQLLVGGDFEQVWEVLFEELVLGVHNKATGCPSGEIIQLPLFEVPLDSTNRRFHLSNSGGL